MVRCYNVGRLVSQEVSGIEFVNDPKDGKIQYASFKGQSNRQKIVVGEDFWSQMSLIIMYVLASFGGRDVVNDFLGKITPIIRGSLSRLRRFSHDSVSNVLTDIWLIVSRNNQKTPPYDAGKSDLTTWIDYRCRLESTRQIRGTRRAKMFGLSKVLKDLDGEDRLEFWGLRSLWGVSFEPSDPDETLKGGWIKGKKVENPTFDRVARQEESAGLKKVLSRIDQDDAIMLRDYFGGVSVKGIAKRMKISTTLVRKRVVRTINRLRAHYKVPGRIVSLGGKQQLVKFVEVD